MMIHRLKPLGTMLSRNRLVLGNRTPFLGQQHNPVRRLLTTQTLTRAVAKSAPWAAPEHAQSIAYWLFGTAGLTLTMIVVGGITRLTKSGLSMTSWKLTGSLPPRTPEEWEAEFAAYKNFPEHRRLGREMPMSEFKRIYFWEYSHRMLGRSLGLVFGLPLLYHLARGRVRGPLAKRLGLLFAMGGTQGMVGWWMVKSGLKDKGNGTYNDLAKVGPYELAAHLMSAFVIFSLLSHTALGVWRARPKALAKAKSFVAAPRTLRSKVYALGGLLAVTVASGAFVAGNEAGLCYNQFPLMGDSLVPADYINPAIQPGWKNLFENNAAVQFDHRVLATTTLVGALTVAGLAHRHPGLSHKAVRASRLVAGVATAQYSLGVVTLLNHVPVSLGSAHQFGAMTLMASTIYFLHALRHGLPRSSANASIKATATTTTPTGQRGLHTQAGAEGQSQSSERSPFKSAPSWMMHQRVNDTTTQVP